MACGHSRRGASPTPNQEETNGCSLLTLLTNWPSRPATFSLLTYTTDAKGRHGGVQNTKISISSQ
tara:strand:- start:322 stop:516 length:195 start_codon:yes stop_codon:yes gene_type:complete